MFLVFLGVLSTGPGMARADELPLGDPALTADPNAPMFAYGYRGGARGRFSLHIPILSPEHFSGAYLALRPLAELHNEEAIPLDGPAFLPLSFWRARLVLEAGYAPQVTVRGTPVQLGFGLMIEHESNHATDRSAGGFLSFHDVGVRTQLSVRVHPMVLLAAQLVGRVMFASCTKLAYGCTGDTGTGGFETVADVWVEVGLQDTAFGGAFAVHASYLPETESLIEEWRVALRGGLIIASQSVGRFQLFIEALFGRDVGLFRAQEVARVGVGFGWAI
ncbi:MAG: hypothetical protein JRH11_11010 [Deltaproteobacteria bacterium]|nr:hypothetical protein [Deltaproteobacteria bacterium]